MYNIIITFYIYAGLRCVMQQVAGRNFLHALIFRQWSLSVLVGIKASLVKLPTATMKAAVLAASKPIDTNVGLLYLCLGLTSIALEYYIVSECHAACDGTSATGQHKIFYAAYMLSLLNGRFYLHEIYIIPHRRLSFRKLRQSTNHRA